MGTVYSAASGEISRQESMKGECASRHGVGTSSFPKKWQRFVKSSSYWSLQEVVKARARFAEIYEENAVFLIGRRVHWEVFTEYDFAVMNQGEFLSLPLEIFDMFEEQRSGVADIREIFCLLALTCRAQNLSSKLEACFPFFGPTMTEERVAAFLMTLQRGLKRLGIIAERMPQNQVQEVAGRICGEGAWRKCQTVSAQLLADWLANSPDVKAIADVALDLRSLESKTYTLLRSKADLKARGTVLKREVKKLTSMANPPKSRRSKQREHRKTLLRHQPSICSLLGSQTTETLEERDEDENDDDDDGSEGFREKIQTTSEEEKERDEDLQAANAAEAISKFDASDLKILQGSWEKARASRKGLSKDQFAAVVSTQFPSVTNPSVVGRMFNLFDTDHNGFLSWDEFIMGVSRMVTGSLEDKIRFLFDVANSQENKGRVALVDQVATRRRGSRGNLEEQDVESSSGKPVSSSHEPAMKLVDLVKVIQDTNNEMMECAHLVELIITMMDYDKNGIVDRQEFERAVKEIPHILDSFDECLKPSEDLKRWAQKLERAIPRFNIDNVIRRWRKLGTMKASFKFVDWETFVDFIEPIWEGSGISPKNQMLQRNESSFALANASFRDITSSFKARQEEDGQAGGPADDVVYTLLLNLFRVAIPHATRRCQEEPMVDLRKLLIGIVLSLENGGVRKTQKDARFLRKKGELYFELFDTNCSNSVDYQEFFEMMYTAQLDMQDAGWKAVEILRTLDTNNDGIITFSEFMDTCKKNNDILHCFGRIFHASTDEEDISNLTMEEEEEQQNEPVLQGSASLSVMTLSRRPTTKLLKLGEHTESAPVLPIHSIYRTTYKFRDSPTRDSEEIPATGRSAMRSSMKLNSAPTTRRPSSKSLAPTTPPNAKTNSRARLSPIITITE